MSNSCVGCKFLYLEDFGYSNYTITDTDVKCAKDRNPNLPAEHPWDWGLDDTEKDNWPVTRDSRCDLYAPGVMVQLDVDHDYFPEDATDDAEAIDAIYAHSKRPRKEEA